MEGNMNNGKARDILTLRANHEVDGSTFGAQRRAPIRVASHAADAPVFGEHIIAPIGVLNGRDYFTKIIIIYTGEDIREKIRLDFQAREQFPSCFQGHASLGIILTATGTICSPILDVEGSAVFDEESYTIIRIKGHFAIDRGGRAHEIDNVTISISDSNGDIFGGAVIGPLIAATPIQVAVASFITD